MTYEMAQLESKLEGKEEGKIEIVKNLLFAKTPLKYIVTATGWSEDKISSIKKEIFKNEAQL